MAWFDGIFRCSPLGVDDCVVWWDAISAVGTIASVVATVILGFFTYRLGRAANEASALAASIANAEAVRQSARDRKEQVLVLVEINGEIWENQRLLAILHSDLSDHTSVDRFVKDSDFRSKVIAQFAQVSFPLTRGVMERLHYLDDPVGPTLTRCIGMLRALNEKYRRGVEGEPREDLAAHCVVLRFTAGEMVKDLEVVRAACELAINSSGIDSERIAGVNSSHGGCPE
ncbi:hypothetical protein [Stenotrophomonas sepilia]|uniref:hypothetical protein n=1 Tax=Stenotrophomonas sepilia TaxID=2860290 RepID=UPI002E76367E|nr:hypothetical protein [Stenotrophomonas sepilia]